MKYLKRESTLLPSFIVGQLYHSAFGIQIFYYRYQGIKYHRHMGSVNSINPLETTVLGYSTPQSWTEQPTQLWQNFACRERNVVKINTMLHRKAKITLSSVQGERKCKVKRKKGDHSCTYKYKNNQSG